MENFSQLVRSVETKLRRKVYDKELDFLVWLYNQHQEEKEIKA